MRVGMIGYAFMGAAHSHAWRTAGRFFPLPVNPELAVICGRSAEKVEAAAGRYGWQSWETDWREVVERDDIDVVDICTPGDSHAEIAIAALAAGKHVICEKPLANTVAEATAMVAAASKSPARTMVMFNYRRVPALALARQLIADGRLGTIRHVRAQYLQDWLIDPEAPFTWRMDAASAGSGALGDLGAHSIDIAQHLTGQLITSVGGLLRTFVDSRPLADGSGRADVTVDDAAVFTAQFDGGALGVFEATRFATGRKNAMRIEISGSRGALAFDQEAMNELRFYDASEDAVLGGFRRILVTEPGHPYLDAWWPPGHLIGYEHTFVHQVRDFVVGVHAGEELRPDFADGLRVQRVLAAVLDGAGAGQTEVRGE